MRLGQALVDWWLETSNMFHWHVLSLAVTRFQIFIQCREYLTVKDLEPSNPVDHPLELDPLNVFILAINPLDTEYVVTEVQTLEPPLLSQQYNHGTASPVETLTEQLFHSELVFTNWDAVDEL